VTDKLVISATSDANCTTQGAPALLFRWLSSSGGRRALVWLCADLV
jgi:hypothetical protein